MRKETSFIPYYLISIATVGDGSLRDLILPTRRIFDARLHSCWTDPFGEAGAGSRMPALALLVDPDARVKSFPVCLCDLAPRPRPACVTNEDGSQKYADSPD